MFNFKSITMRRDLFEKICRLSLVMLLAMPVAASAQGRLDKKVTINLNYVSAKEFFDELNKQTGLNFIYNSDQLKLLPAITVHQSDATVKQVLNQVMKQINCSYKYDGNVVMVVRQSATSRSKRVLAGKITDSQGEPLTGVQVKVGGRVAAITNEDGDYRLEIPTQGTTQLTYTYVGMKNYVVNVQHGDKDVRRNVIMASDNNINEVVVTGIYTRNKESFTGSSTSYSHSDLKSVGNGNVLQSLKTLDPSFNVLENTTLGSDPNQTLNIEINGKTNVASLTDSYSTDPNQPLFILDGFESTLTAISDLSMDRVERITILKDAAATAIYGSKAANGVVVVETKTPEAGKLTVNYNGNLNLSWADLSDYNLMNASEKLQFELLSGVYGSTNAQDGNLGSLSKEQLYNQRLAEVARGVDTYWMNEPLRFATSQRHNIFLEGGDKTFRYGVGVNYNKNMGIMKGSDRDVVNGNVKLIYRKGQLAFTNNLNINYVKASHESVPFSTFAQANPYFRKYDENGDVNKVLESFSYLDLNTFSIVKQNIYSPLYNWSNNNTNTTSDIGFTNNFEVEWRPLQELRIHGKFGLTKTEEKTKKFSSPNNTEYIGMDDDEKGLYIESNQDSWDWDFDGSATYGKLFNDLHQVNAVLGMRATQSTVNLSQFAMKGFIDDEFVNPDFAQQYDISRRVYSDTKRRTASYYCNVNYAFDNRYLFDASWRLDGASMFGSNKHFTNTWAVGLGWNIHHEKFMKPVKWVNYLKLRASIGNPGNQNFSDYISMRVYSYNNTHTNPWGVSTIISNFGNSDLKWQKTIDKNIGLDVLLFDSRLRLNLDYIYKNTDPLLVYINQPSSTGATTKPTNVGRLITKGFTAIGSYMIIKRPDLRLSLNANVSHLQSEYRDVSNYLAQFNNENKSKNMIRYYDGGSPTDLWAVRSAGIDPTTGREIFIRKDGTQTFTYNSDDEVVVGNSEPDYQGIIGTSFYWKGLSASVNLRYRLGGQVFMSALYNKVENISTASAHYNQDKRALYDRWQKPGNHAKFKAISTTGSTPMSSRFVEDNNVLSGESISLGYETEAKWLSTIGASSLTFHAYMNDIFRASSVKEERGIDYPFSRSVSFAIGLIF